MKIFDLHQDLFWYSQNPDYIKSKTQSSWDMLKRNCCASFNSLNDWFEPGNNDLIEKNLDSLPKGFYYIKTKEDLQLKKNDNFPIIAHIEGLNSFQGTDEDWEMFERWISKGLRSVGPVWNETNYLGGGTKDEDENSGLTELGIEFVNYCIDSGIIVDLAHANRKTFQDIANILKKKGKPFFISHGNSYSVYPSYRNYTDEQFMQLAESGGVIGVFFANSFISDKKETDLNDIYAHIKYITDLIGKDHIAVGSDFGGILSGSPKELHSLDDIENLEKFLLNKGWSQDDVAKMFYQNSIRVLSEYLS